jgi:hypothetical protein
MPQIFSTLNCFGACDSGCASAGMPPLPAMPFLNATLVRLPAWSYVQLW